MGLPAHLSSVCNRNRRSNQQVKPGVVCNQCRHCSKCGSKASSLDADHQASCALCRQPIAYFQETLACGHAYHGDCLFRWLKKHVTCPKVKNVCPCCGLLPPGGVPIKDVTKKSSDRGHGRRPRSDSSASEASSASSGSNRSSRVTVVSASKPSRHRQTSTSTEISSSSSDSDSDLETGHRGSSRGCH